MKKALITWVAVVALITATVTPVGAINTQRGGFMGFVAGCCFGVRAGAAYNDGKEIHWREWFLLIPIVGLVCSVWNGVEGANGMTSKDYVEKYGSAYY